MIPGRCHTALILGAVLAGCGSGDEPGGSGAATPTPPPAVISSPEGATAPPVEATETAPPSGVATLRDDRFEPGRIEVEAGDPLTFVNEDDHEHEIAIEGQAPALTVAAGASATFPAPKPGTHRLVCRIHEEAGMVGRLVVRR